MAVDKAMCISEIKQYFSDGYPMGHIPVRDVRHSYAFQMREFTILNGRNVDSNSFHSIQLPSFTAKDISVRPTQNRYPSPFLSPIAATVKLITDGHTLTECLIAKMRNVPELSRTP
jgi:hypothetical protein